MAKITRWDQPESIQSIEVSHIDLTEEEKHAFRASPEKFMKNLLESEGYKVNRLVIDPYLIRDGDGGDGDGGVDPFPCRCPLINVHVKLGFATSTHTLICPCPE
ncbi:hypothetical protein AB0D10_41885 [Kitasatospora sp. NPDC048545]|uniref:hypothetical protein n=1 Tax=Kitasatospora sp. NPDC048545 TaxID=3157208 RepID=UPI00340A4BAE